MQDLTTGSVTRHLLRTTSFMLVSMVFQTLYFLIDLYWVGRLGKEAVAAVGLAVGTLLVIPLLSVTSPVIGIENVGAIAAVRRSWSLTKRHYKHSCAYVLFGASVVFLLGLLFGWLPSSIAASLGDDGYGWVVVGLASVMFATITTAFIAIGSVIFYLDLRVRSEGMDIEIAAAELFPDA